MGRIGVTLFALVLASLVHAQPPGGGPPGGPPGAQVGPDVKKGGTLVGAQTGVFDFDGDAFNVTCASGECDINLVEQAQVFAVNCTNATSDTSLLNTAISNAVSAGGGVVEVRGTCLVNDRIEIDTTTTIVLRGAQSGTIKADASGDFTGVNECDSGTEDCVPAIVSYDASPLWITDLIFDLNDKAVAALSTKYTAADPINTPVQTNGPVYLTNLYVRNGNDDGGDQTAWALMDITCDFIGGSRPVCTYFENVEVDCADVATNNDTGIKLDSTVSASRYMITKTSVNDCNDYGVRGQSAVLNISNLTIDHTVTGSITGAIGLSVNNSAVISNTTVRFIGANADSSIGIQVIGSEANITSTKVEFGTNADDSIGYDLEDRSTLTGSHCEFSTGGTDNICVTADVRNTIVGNYLAVGPNSFNVYLGETSGCANVVNSNYMSGASGVTHVLVNCDQNIINDNNAQYGDWFVRPVLYHDDVDANAVWRNYTNSYRATGNNVVFMCRGGFWMTTGVHLRTNTVDWLNGFNGNCFNSDDLVANVWFAPNDGSQIDYVPGCSTHSQIIGNDFHQDDSTTSTPLILFGEVGRTCWNAQTQRRCTGGSNNGLSCSVNGDCPSGTCDLDANYFMRCDDLSAADRKICTGVTDKPGSPCDSVADCPGTSPLCTACSGSACCVNGNNCVDMNCTGISIVSNHFMGQTDTAIDFWSDLASGDVDQAPDLGVIDITGSTFSFTGTESFKFNTNATLTDTVAGGEIAGSIFLSNSNARLGMDPYGGVINWAPEYGINQIIPQESCAKITNPTTTDLFEVMNVSGAGAQIVEITCYCRGATTASTGPCEDATDGMMEFEIENPEGTVIESVTECGNEDSSPKDAEVTTVTPDAWVDANETLLLDVTNNPNANGEYTVCVRYQ